MALEIKNAILHIVGRQEGDSHFSREELDIDSEICYEFISKHVKRLLNNPAAKEACFSADSAVYADIRLFQQGDIFFKELSTRISRRLADIVQANPDIPPADILVTSFENRKSQYLAILKLNYSECFTHRIRTDEGGSDNQIVKHTTVLPFGSGRVEEACLIPYDPMVLRILEKSYEAGGEQVNYFSQLFLQCDTSLSKKEAAEIIHQVVDEINLKYYDNDVEMAAQLKYTLIEEAEEAGTVCLENVAKKVFQENEPVKNEFIAMAKDAGLPYDVDLGEAFVKQQFKTQKFKADNGIEISCPSELFKDPETIQIITNGDGTISVTIKNLREAQ